MYTSYSYYILLVHVAIMHTTHVLGMHTANMLLRDDAATHDVHIMMYALLLPKE